MDRKHFIRIVLPAGLSWLFLPGVGAGKQETPYVMTVKGKVESNTIGTTLAHEHITTDFTGAEKVKQPQYSPLEAFPIILPWLQQLKAQGVSMLTECTPQYIGRDVELLRLLSNESGMHIMTNTGYYAAVEQKYLPQHAFNETAEQLAGRFLQEWTQGIDATGIRPGFIKLGVDKGPLKEVEKKLIHAGALTHLKSGLKIAIHTGDAVAAKEEFELLTALGVAPGAFIWVHAQNDPDGDTQITLAKKGCWVSLDGINASAGSMKVYGDRLMRLKENNALGQVLISHDDGWSVNKNGPGEAVTFKLFENGNTVPYQTILTHFKPYMLQRGFTERDFEQLLVKNPSNAYSVNICRLP